MHRDPSLLIPARSFRAHVCSRTLRLTSSLIMSARAYRLRAAVLTAAMMAAGTTTSPACAFPASWNAVCEGFVMQYP